MPPLRDLIVYGEGKLDDGSVLRRRAAGPGLMIGVSGATAQGVVDRQRPLTASWLGLDLPAALGPQPPATLDMDGDGMSDAAEAMAGTNPSDAADYLRAVAIRRVEEGVFIEWTSKDSRRYAVLHSSGDSLQDWSEIARLDGQPNFTAYTDEEPTRTGSPGFYRIRAFPLATGE